MMRASAWPDLWLALRSVAWTVLLPGLFAGYLPWRYFGLGNADLRLSDPLHLAGLACIGLGVLLLGTCIWEFARSGRGTLSPIDPPRQLVVRGLYRYVRNPMYLSVTLIVLGEFLLTRSTALLVYWAVWFVAVNIVVIGYEEPTLRRQFGAAYERYQSEVGRWLPRLRRFSLAAVLAATAFGSGCGTPFGPQEVLQLGAIASVILLETGESISPTPWYTIERMYELIPSFGDLEFVDDVQVTYDHMLGYPNSILVRYQEGTLDAGDFYIIGSVAPSS
ncbi:MAG TPA: methyltransferase [Gemmatimonadales bacterium]|nr:methyltransferase [Gemmatimonadales bacterium]